MRRRLRENILVSDYDRIVTLVEPGSSVLDLGCGNGDLLMRLQRERRVRGQGVEIDQNAVIECIRKGLSVFQGNIDQGLADYADASYDYVILNQTLQVIRRPAFVIEEMLRVGRKGIVSFPNFGNWLVRAKLLVGGRMPRTKKLPFHWYDTPNIHLLTIGDFLVFCRRHGIEIQRQVNLVQTPVFRLLLFFLGANLIADEGLFVIRRRPGT